jgi:acetyl/propionyl-CoA carboxylase alpha subunit
VEHGITEMITGIDLVIEQIRVAEGYPLSFSQKDIRCQGHAIESRIYAEDPEKDLLPSPGKIQYYREPSLQSVRLESAVSSGTVIHSDFDPLIAKVITHGINREDAIVQMKEALEQTVITGVRHNIPLIDAILADKDFRLNALSTTYLQEKYQLFKMGIATRKKRTEVRELILAGTLISLFSPKSNQSSLWKSLGYWRITPRIGFRYNYLQYGSEYRIISADSADIWYNSEEQSITKIRIDSNEVSYYQDNVYTSFYFVPESNGVIVITKDGLDFELKRADRLESLDFSLFEEEAVVEQELVRSPLPGKVNRIFVKMNDKVNKGDHLITIESMKLENGILAPHEGTVQQILTSEGAQVRYNDPLIFIKPL